MDAARVVVSLVGILFVIAAAYYVTYFVASRRPGISRGRNRNINLLDRFAISKDKSFCLVEIAGKVYVIGVTNQAMTLIDTLDPENFAETNSASANGTTQPNIDNMPAWQRKIVRRMSSFLTQRRGNTGGKDVGGTGFADSMKSAYDKESAPPPDNPEEDG